MDREQHAEALSPEALRRGNAAGLRGQLDRRRNRSVARREALQTGTPSRYPGAHIFANGEHAAAAR